MIADWPGDLYHVVIVYVWPTETAGAQVPVSWTLTSFRSPFVQAVTSSFSPKLPLWASVVRVQAKVLVPYPPSSQHVGVDPLADSSEGFCSRFALELATVTVAPAETVLLPEMSTALARTTCDPFATLREFQLKL